MTARSKPTGTVITTVSVLLSLFVLSEVNYPFLTPQSQLAGFGGLGLSIVYLMSGPAALLNLMLAIADQLT